MFGLGKGKTGLYRRETEDADEQETTDDSAVPDSEEQEQEQEPAADFKAPEAERRVNALDTSNSEALMLKNYCTPTNAPDLGPKFSTVIKVEALDGWVRFCDGRVATTRIMTVAKNSRANRGGGEDEVHEE